MNVVRMRLHSQTILLVLGMAVFCTGARADPFVPDQELLDSWGVLQIGAGRVHQMGITGAGVKVGIIDSGIDYTHPELSANYAGGWDFVGNDANPMDDYGHGTLVAGIIGAADDDTGIVGVAPQASLYAYKVYDSSGPNINTLDLVIAAIERAIIDGVQVINMSFGSVADPGLALAGALNAAIQAGITIVASVGNEGLAPTVDGNIRYPAAYSSVIAIGSTDMADVRSSFSNTGPELELVAPGESIVSTDTGVGLSLPVYLEESGTSLASAHVAGTAALLIEAGYTDVRGRMISTALDLGYPGFDELYGYGRVDAYGAVVPLPSAALLALLGLSAAHRVGRFRRES